jgi:nitroimidazol reductase NimA-like FMN-containing flavoprotein (pyridoxamine 5'-phosphate oxidase superfamily)
LHVAFHTSPDQDEFSFPVILPMLGCMGRFEESTTQQHEEGSKSLYLHGYVSSRIMRLSKVVGDEGTSSIPVCVSATLMDGIVLALTPNHHSCNYRSAVVFGHAHVVEDEAERLYAMELITNNLVPERWEHTRYPNKTELKSTGILRVDIHSASAKVRTGTTGEAREDLKNEEMRKDMWAGVIPMWTQFGAPIPAPTNLVKNVPKYIDGWVTKNNSVAQKFCVDGGQ